MSIADKIKDARLKKEYTQEQVAENLMVSRQTISNWENGKSLPDIVSIIHMSELYGLSLDEMMKGDKVLMDKIEKDVRIVKAEKKLVRFAWVSIAIGVLVMILGFIFKDNAVIDFIKGALPWICFGLMFIFTIMFLDKGETK